MNMSDAIRKGYWSCACVKRDLSGNIAAIRLNSPKVKRCRSCKAVRPEATDKP